MALFAASFGEAPVLHRRAVATQNAVFSERSSDPSEQPRVNHKLNFFVTESQLI